MPRFDSLLVLAAAQTTRSRIRRTPTSTPLPAHLGTHTYSPPPTVNEEEEARALEPYPGFYELIDGCLQKIPEECSQQMFNGIIGIHDNVTAVSDLCCEDLVAIGEECHLKILNATMMPRTEPVIKLGG
ncbi:hypothetical protein OROMI_009304 [Orobanche minor]